MTATMTLALLTWHFLWVPYLNEAHPLLASSIPLLVQTATAASAASHITVYSASIPAVMNGFTKRCNCGISGVITK